MRWSGLLVLGAILSACGVKKYLPAGPVIDARARAAYDVGAASPAVYTGDPKVGFPVIPLQVWGVAYDLDLVLESTHPDYDMHEYARVQTPEGPVWLAKDALSANKLQSIVADLPDLDRWVPELPIERKSFPVEVRDRSTADWLDLRIAYENLAGEPVVVTYEGKAPRSAQRKRNGNTMGHSAAIALAALDIPYRDFGRRASVSIGGADYKIRKLVGLVGLKVVLVQTQGGLAIGELAQRGGPDGFEVRYAVQGVDVPTEWAIERADGRVVATQEDPFRSLVYTWADRDGALELERMEVHQYQVDAPVVTIAIQPALPDMRRPFEGRVRSGFAVDVHGQPGKAIGELEAWWEDGVAKIALIPTEPEWVTDRPMQTAIRYRDGRAEISIQRVEVEGS